MNLIDRNALIDKIQNHAFEYPDCYYVTTYAELLVSEAPVIDAIPVVHGEWIDYNPEDDNDPRMRCSVCGIVQIPFGQWSYCPNCGADVRERENK